MSLAWLDCPRLCVEAQVDGVKTQSSALCSYDDLAVMAGQPVRTSEKRTTVAAWGSVAWLEMERFRHKFPNVYPL